MTMFGRMSTTTAALTSMTRLSSGVLRVGNPKPMAPLMRAAASTAPAARTGVTTGA